MYSSTTAPGDPCSTLTTNIQYYQLNYQLPSTNVKVDYNISTCFHARMMSTELSQYNWDTFLRTLAFSQVQPVVPCNLLDGENKLGSSRDKIKNKFLWLFEKCIAPSVTAGCSRAMFCCQSTRTGDL